MILFDSPHIPLQNFLCLDIGTKKTGIAYNFAQSTIAFSFKTIATEELLSCILGLASKHQFNKIIVGLPLAYPESEHYLFIAEFTIFLQENLPSFDFIFWDETNTSNEIRQQRNFGRKGFSKKFHQNYDKQSATLILSEFLTCGV